MIVLVILFNVLVAKRCAEADHIFRNTGMVARIGPLMLWFNLWILVSFIIAILIDAWLWTGITP